MTLARRYREDPGSVLDEYRLTDTERQYLLDSDVRSIYEVGVPPLLVRMGVQYLLGGMDTPTYKELLAGAVQAQD
jgi:hypothetical protein